MQTRVLRIVEKSRDFCRKCQEHTSAKELLTEENQDDTLKERIANAIHLEKDTIEDQRLQSQQVCQK